MATYHLRLAFAVNYHISMHVLSISANKTTAIKINYHAACGGVIDTKILWNVTSGWVLTRMLYEEG